MICICAPYGRTETTAAALRLADLCLTQQREVRFLALGTCERRVHPYWDGRVVRSEALYRPAQFGRAEHVIWFDVAGQLLARTARLWPDAQQILVASWHRLQPEQRSSLSSYHRVVCPAPAVQRALRPLVGPRTTVDAVLWDAGLTPLRRSLAALAATELRVTFLCDAHAVDECGAALLHLVDEVLGLPQRLAAVHLLALKAWSRRDRQRLSRLRRRHGARLVVGADVSWPAQMRVFNETHVCVLPGIRADFGLWALRALACGVPVLTYGISPYTAFLRHGYNSWLLRGETVSNWCAAVTAVPALAAFLGTLTTLLARPETLGELVMPEGPLATLASNFALFWEHCLAPR